MIRIKIETDCKGLKDAGTKVKKVVSENTKPVASLIGWIILGGVFFLFGLLGLYFGFTEEPGALIMGFVITGAGGILFFGYLGKAFNYDQYKDELKRIVYADMTDELKEKARLVLKRNPKFSKLDEMEYCPKENVFWGYGV